MPVTELIDQRLTAGQTDGWHYEDMPEDGEAWRRSLAALDEEAAERLRRTVPPVDPRRAGALWSRRCRTLTSGTDSTAAHLWSLWTRYACTAFYSHPWAWNEMGFGGPAYPRGYKNLGIDKRERWERPETDAADPVPWADRRESAQRAHE